MGPRKLFQVVCSQVVCTVSIHATEVSISVNRPNLLVVGSRLYNNNTFCLSHTQKHHQIYPKMSRLLSFKSKAADTNQKTNKNKPQANKTKNPPICVSSMYIYITLLVPNSPYN